MADESIGSVKVDIVADYSKLSQGFQAAQGEAAKAGASIASSFSSAVSPADALTQATNRLKAAEAALSSEGAKMLAQVQPTALGFQSAQAALAKMNGELNAAQAAMRGAASSAGEVTRSLHGQVSELQATSGAIRTLEGNGGLRAVENFISKTLGLGPAMKAIFPIVGAIAFGEIVGHIAEKFTEFYQRAAQGGERAKGEFRELTLGLETTNDALQLANDKLDNQIAKLTGKHQNALKEMIDDAALSADHLASRIDAAMKGLIDLIKQEKIGFGEAAFTNQGTTSKFDEKLGGKSGLGGKRAEIADIEDASRAKIKAAREANDLDAANNARSEARNKLEKEYAGLIAASAGELRVLQGIQAVHEKGGIKAFAVPDQSKNIEIQKAITRNLAAQRESSLLEFEHVNKEQEKAEAEASKRSSDQAKKAAEEQMHAWQEQLEIQKSQGAISLTQERSYWASLLPIAEAGGAAFKDVRRKIETDIGNLTQQIIRQRHEADIHEVQAQEKDFADQLKGVMEKATESTGMPKTAGLQFVQAKLEAPTIDEGAYKEALKQLPGLTKGAVEESEQLLRGMVRDSDEEFAEIGQHSAAEMSAYYARVIDFLQRIGGAEDEIRQKQRQKREADKQVTAQTLKVADIGAKGEASHAESGIQAEKVQLQAQYELQIFHTFEQQVQYARDLAALEERSLQLKVAKAVADFTAATAAGDVVRAMQATVELEAADDALRNHRLATETQIAAIQQKNSLGGEIKTGLNQDAQSAVTKLSSGIAGLVTQTKGWGQEFKNVLKQIEQSLIQTFASSVLKQGLNALMGATTGKPQAAPASAATAAGTAALTGALVTNTAATTAHTGIMATHLGVMVSHMGAMIANTVTTIANTIATIAGTIADWALTAVETIKAFFGFAAGGGDISGPTIVGEEGPELIVPSGTQHVFTAPRTRSILAQSQQAMRSPIVNMGMAIPDTPGGSAAFLRASGSSNTMTPVSNQNTGHIGDNHFPIYGANNPREVVRQISDFMKRQTGKYSPGNS